MLRSFGSRAVFRGQLEGLLADRRAAENFAPPPRTGVGIGVPESSFSTARTPPRVTVGWARRKPAWAAAVGHHRRRVQAAGGRQVDGHRAAPPHAEQCGQKTERHDAGGDDGDRGQDRQPGSTGQGTVFLTSRSTTTGSSMWSTAELASCRGFTRNRPRGDRAVRAMRAAGHAIFNLAVLKTVAQLTQQRHAGDRVRGGVYWMALCKPSASVLRVSTGL